MLAVKVCLDGCKIVIHKFASTGAQRFVSDQSNVFLDEATRKEVEALRNIRPGRLMKKPMKGSAILKLLILF